MLVLNALSAHIAILDRAGTIVHTNRAWRDFATTNGMSAGSDSIGVNYLEICAAAEGDDAPLGHLAAEGIRQIIAGRLTEFLMDYPCHSPTEKRWFHMRVTRLLLDGSVHAVVSHENVTNLKLVQEQLEAKEDQLQWHVTDLEEANIALKVLLKQREQDRRELEEDVLTNVQKRVLPYLGHLRRQRPNKEQMNTIELIEACLLELTSPFMRHLDSALSHLTPREIQVATLVKDGHTTKEIASLLDLSRRAIEFHRDNIRKKFGLKKRKLNLRSFLLTLAE